MKIEGVFDPHRQAFSVLAVFFWCMHPIGSHLTHDLGLYLNIIAPSIVPKKIRNLEPSLICLIF